MGEYYPAIFDLLIVIVTVIAFIVFLIMRTNTPITGAGERETPTYTDSLATLAKRVGVSSQLPRSSMAVAIALAIAESPDAASADELATTFASFVRGTTSRDVVAALDKDNRWWTKITRGQEQIDHLEVVTRQCCTIAWNKVKSRIGSASDNTAGSASDNTAGSAADNRILARALAAGIKIYADKPNLGSDTTWTPAEYSMPEFQLVYLRIKALQRYTENYTLAELAGVKPRRVVSIGGGCGFEITALRDYAEAHGSSIQSVTIIDIVDTWRDYCPVTCGEVVFITSDINNPSEDALAAIADADTIVFSYVFRYLAPGFFDSKFAGKTLLFNERNQPVSSVDFSGRRAQRLSNSLYLVGERGKPSRQTFTDM